jgi:hypothetical protein
LVPGLLMFEFQLFQFFSFPAQLGFVFREDRDLFGIFSFYSDAGHHPYKGRDQSKAKKQLLSRFEPQKN